MVRRTKEEAEVTRQRILDAAEVIFQRNGVSKTTLNDIAQEANVTRGAIYWHFENKVSVYDAMIHRIIDPVEDKLAELQAQHINEPLVFIRTMMLFFLNKLATDPRYYCILEIAWQKCEYVGEMAEIRNRHLECGNRFAGIYTEAIEKAKAQGDLPKSLDAKMAAVGLMAVKDGLIANWTLDRNRFPLGEMAEGIMDFYLAGIAAEPKSK